MTDDLNATAELLRGLIGRQVVAVTEARHWYDGRREGDVESLLHFWLHFDGNPPLLAHGCGEHLLLEFGEPYAAYDMGGYGETRVGPAQAPDLLAVLPGQRLLNAALIHGYTLEPAVGGVLLRFDHDELVVASYGDEWLLTKGAIPSELAAHLAVGDRLGESTTG